MRTPDSRASREAYRMGALSLLIASATILTALGYQYIGGLEPCHLCLIERTAYYAALPLLFISLIALTGGQPGWAAAGFLLVSLAFLANVGLGAYHTGAELSWWAGPSTCSGPLRHLDSPADLLAGRVSANVVRCDKASWWFLGLSMAGWNTVVSAALWITAFLAARAAWHARARAESQIFI